MKHHEPEQDEVELFRRSIGDVTLVKQDKIQGQSSKPAPKAAQRMADEAAVINAMVDGGTGAIYVLIKNYPKCTGKEDSRIIAGV